MNTTKTVTTAEVWTLLAAVFTDHRHLWQPLVVERMGLPFSRFRALRRIERRPMSGAGLAAELGVDAPAASLIVSDLADRGLVRKEPDESDGRRKIVTVTPQGRALMDDIRALPGPVPGLEALSPTELSTLHTLLAKVQGHR
ncbi:MULTISPECIES: MarR family winged helix-turn-helix transcriptional regulator [Arsenicicoccus]|uniref:MarR family winged helix-turn-helix transcriptional regulator n=1 Tax=Arsenicicoccus TaxID=267408 RepID=UPI00041DE3B3|nr:MULTISPECIES: MarR family transcriptional regulator [Arsenicicoccus]